MRYFFLLLIIPATLFCENKDYIELHCRHAGLFSVMQDVLNLCKHYDNGEYAGIEINFADEGLYYDPAHGTNWFTYYFEPIQFGERNNVKNIIGSCPGSIPWEIESHTSRDQAKRLIDKYIHIKPHVLKKIAKLQLEFKGYVVCVHYRGTDKRFEARRVDYQEMRLEIDELVNNQPDFKVFVATDEQTFINYMLLMYGDKVIYNQDALRALGFDPLHMGNYDKYKCGEEAIIDAVLLSRGDYLIRTSSNLSRWSTFLNPHIPVKEMNQPGF